MEEPTTQDRPDTRTIAGALVAVVVLQLLFAFSYIAAFHDPSPHGVPLAVAAPTEEAAAQVAQGLEREGGDAVTTTVVADESAATARVRDREAAAALVVGPKKTDRLYIASAAGVSQAQAIEARIRDAESRQGRTLKVADLAPLPSADSRGTTPFYLVLVMAFGGYLGVTVLSLLASPQASRGRRALQRLGAMAAYAVISGVAVTLLARAAFGLVEGHVLAVAAATSLVGYATASVAITLQAVFGTAGTGLVILLFVVLGNPSSGGAVPYDFLPGWLGALGPFLVNGAGVDLVRNLVYFDGNALARPLAVLAVWALAGSIGAVSVSAARYRRSGDDPDLAPAVAAGL
ncbi:DUF3533 domain-containing protein [Nocardioides fonticola]|uniref:DUF3533 domain-containing protein n=1 Tax=Nocardioides fonticola TaxID=450363 RepID=A0ABP7XJ77_9ACTN